MENNNLLFLILIFGSFLQCIYDIFIINRTSKKVAKKAHYNCDNCENWKCFVKYCEKKRLEVNNDRYN